MTTLNRCNVYRCKTCHPYSLKLTENEIKAIKEKNLKSSKPRQLKYCSNKCKLCKAYIIRAIYYIEQKILEYYLASQQIQEHKNIQNQDEKEKKLNEVRKKIDQAPERISLADNNLKISDNFIQKKVSGDRNCLYRSILESLGIYQKKKIKKL